MLDIGSISHGTLRPQDLSSAILDVWPEEEKGTKLHKELQDISRSEMCAEEIISDAIDTLQEYAPAFCYVGMHEGDGSDLGVWPDFDAIDWAEREGDLVKISDLSELDGREDVPEYAALITDHGNVTIYKLKREIVAESLWAIV